MATPEWRQQCTATEEEKRMSTPEQRQQHIATEAESKEWPHLIKDNNKQDYIRHMGAERHKTTRVSTVAFPQVSASQYDHA